MAELLYNFRNVIEEEMTQKEMGNSPMSQDFIKKWTWNREDGCHHKPLFRRSTTIEDYFYIRFVHDDKLLGIGAVRIHWNKEGNFMLDTTSDILLVGTNYTYCQNPHDLYDVKGVIRDKINRYLAQKIIRGRFWDDCAGSCDMPPDKCHCHVPPKPPAPIKPPPPPPPPPIPPHRPGNLPKNGPYGGVYNAYDDVRCVRCDPPPFPPPKR